MKRIMTRKATQQSAKKAVTATTVERLSVTKLPRNTTNSLSTNIVLPSTKVQRSDVNQSQDALSSPSFSSEHASAAALQLLESGPKPLTGFQRKVLQALCRVPAGYVTTYKQLAQSIQCSSNQAVGQALRRNPYAPTVPCHRVVATTAFTTSGSDKESSSNKSSSGTSLASSSSSNKKGMSPIGGFGGCLSGKKIDKKIQLLQTEGVQFIDAKRGTIDPSCLYTFPVEN